MENVIIEKWNEILITLKNEHDISDVSFKTWLMPLKVYSVTDNLVTIIVPDQQLGLDYIKKKYLVPLSVIIAELTGHVYDIELVTPNDVKNVDQKTVKHSSYMDNVINAGLNPNYTFDTFVVGANNNLAHAASLAVAESPAEVYNPLFIYGGVGLGKTHLMHSIAHFILQHNPDAKVLYVTSEKFTNELIDSIKKDSNIAFREKYRNIDVLLIDDIQFIIGKDSTQEEFFHTFNTLRESKKQIIISSDKPPKDFETLEERLRSRFEWGLTVDIQSPDYETRMAILKKKEELEGYNIDNDVIKYIATNIKSNIRELEGALTKIVAYSTLVHREINIQLAEEALKDLISPDVNKEVTPELIIQVVAEHFNISPSDLSSKKRNKEIVYPRQIAMYLCRTITETPLQSIGAYLGKKDHTTVIHAIEKITSEMNTKESTRNLIDILTKKINPQ